MVVQRLVKVGFSIRRCPRMVGVDYGIAKVDTGWLWQASNWQGLVMARKGLS
jgi:hypothetical protein